MTNTRVAWLVFIFGLIFFGTTVGIITRHTIVSRQQRNFFESLRLSDRYIYERTASNAKEQIMKAASLARTEFDYLRVMRRASHFSSVWDDPQLLLNIVQMAVAIEPQQQRFWVLAVDAAMQAEDFSVARDWALEKLVHPDFKGMVLEAVLRSGGITYSDGTAFGDKLLLLSRLLKDKNPDDFVQAAELTLDGRYAIDAILLLLNRGEHGRALEVLENFPEIRTLRPELAILLTADTGSFLAAHKLLKSFPPSPEGYTAFNIDQLEAEILARIESWDLALSRYNELISSSMPLDDSDIKLANNSIYVMQQSGASFEQLGEQFLFFLKQLPENPDLALSLKKWYKGADNNLNPFEIELQFLHNSLQTINEKSTALHGDSDDFSLLNAIWHKNETGLEAYGARLWLAFQDRPEDTELALLYFFHSGFLGDYDGLLALKRYRPDLFEANKIYFDIFSGDYASALKTLDSIDVAKVDPRTLYNLGLLCMFDNQLDSALALFDAAIQRSYALSNHQAKIRSYACTGKATVYALFGELGKSLAELQLAAEYDAENILPRQVQLFISREQGVIQ